MPSKTDFEAWAEALSGASYYGILQLPQDASAVQIKVAFHSLALTCHPDNFAGQAPSLAAAAASVFKRGVEAYTVLSRPTLREKYDAELAKGRLRLDERKLPSAPPPPPMRTLEMVAKTPKAKGYAVKADRLLSVGDLEGARLQLINACQQEPNNTELAERLQVLYEALALEPF